MGSKARRFISPACCRCSLAPSVTAPLYRTTVSQALRQTLRRRSYARKWRISGHTSPPRFVGGVVVPLVVSPATPLGFAPVDPSLGLATALARSCAPLLASLLDLTPK